MILDISVVLQSQKSSNKDPDHSTIIFCASTQQHRKERSSLLVILFFFLKTIELKTKQQEGKFRFLHMRSCRGSAVTNAWAGSAAALHMEPEGSRPVQT